MKKIILKILTDTGYPEVIYTTPQDRRKRYRAMYFRSRIQIGTKWLYSYMTSDRMRGYSGNYRETDPDVIAALEKLQWVDGRDCLASAPWLQAA